MKVNSPDLPKIDEILINFLTEVFTNNLEKLKNIHSGREKNVEFVDLVKSFPTSI